MDYHALAGYTAPVLLIIRRQRVHWKFTAISLLMKTRKDWNVDLSLLYLCDPPFFEKIKRFCLHSYDATPADCFEVSMAADPFWPTYLQIMCPHALVRIRTHLIFAPLFITKGNKCF